MEQVEKLQLSAEITNNENILNAIQILMNKKKDINDQNVSKRLDEIKLLITDKNEDLKTAFHKIDDVTSSLSLGNIELNNQMHEEKLLQFFLMFSTIQAPGKGPGREQLFKKFTQTDAALILRNHFASFKHKKKNTIEKNIGQANQTLSFKNPKVERLNEALADYFYY